MAKEHSAAIERELGPFDGVDRVLGVSFDGERVWCATGADIRAVDPQSGDLTARIEAIADAGTAYDGRYLYQLAEATIRKIDPESHEVVHTIDAPSGEQSSGMTWAEGSLWVGDFQGSKIHRVDPETGEVLATITSNRFVTGVTWVDGSLWHGSKDDDTFALVRVDHESGAVEERVVLEAGVTVTGVTADGEGGFYCGGGNDGRLRHVRRRKA